ncbi:hypothetical protein BDV97DRAFT_338631 [Delphinella strobiligena]|nr:hypothetical protein BDV97DRAFT_338631 [Delphinella strobiligena]
MPQLNDDVEDPDTKTSNRLTSIKDYLNEEISESWGDLVLILLCFSTGLLDSAVFNVWSCFVSMQTGNTVYTGLGLSGQPKSQPLRWAKSLTSIASFTLGSLLFSRSMRFLGPKKRSTITLSFLLQALLTFIAATLVYTNVVPQNAGVMLPENFIVLLPLSLLAFQSAGQIILSRILGFGEVTTVVLTTAYCDMFFDPRLVSAGLKENETRNRRAASVVVLAAGAVAGGFLTRGGDIGVALWVAGGIKVAVAGVWMAWRGKEGEVRLE